MSRTSPFTATPLAPLALVTGGGGFLGGAIVEQLVAGGHRVRTFARGDYPELCRQGVEHVRGDLRDAGAVERAVAGCDVVFHVAAKAGVWGAYRDYYADNVTGTDHVLAACRAAGVTRLVYTSSPSVVFDGTDMEGVDESVPYAKNPKSAYSATKAIAEQRVLEANSAALRTIALRPHLIWGPRDNHIVPRLIRRARSGRLRIVGDGTNRVDVTYIDNAAQAHLLAAEALLTNPAAAGRAYFISQGAAVNAWEFINRMLDCAQIPPVRKRISRGAARLAGACFEGAYKLLGVRAEPPMTRFLADELAASHWFDISAARRELGFLPRVGLEEGLERLRAWLSTGERC